MTNNPAPQLDELIQRVRDEAARMQAAEPPAVTGEPARPANAGGRGERGTLLRAGSFDELLAGGSDESFVRLLYLSLLGREPDPAGAAGLHQQLQAGVRRTRLIAQIAGSAEARMHNSHLPGRGLALPVNRLAARLQATPLRPFGRLIERLYSQWRHLRLALNGQGLRRLGQQHEYGITQLHQRLDSDIPHLHQRLDDELGFLRLRLRQIEQQQARQGARLVLGEEQLARQRDSLNLQGRGQQASAERLDEQRRELDLLRVRLNLLMQRPPQEAPPAGAAPQAEPAADPLLAERLDAYYVAFEDAHRGSEAEIRRRLQPYLDCLPLLPAQILDLPMLDIGCGRGEWLRLLGEQGFTAIGVDLNRAMVEHCRAQGLDAHHRDALAWLQGQPDASCALISAFHVVEHLPFEVLFRLLEEARRVLAPGGVLIFETPNPENVLVGSHTFYHDFSHRNPVTPSSLQFLVGYHGFAVDRLLRLNPYPPEARVAGATPVAERVNGHFCGPQDYGIVACQPHNPADEHGVAGA